MSTDTRPWLHGLLELCLLGLLANGPDYGMSLIARLDSAGLGQIPGGTLYPALLRLETTGLVSSSRQRSESGPPRKYFELTAAGLDELDARRSEWVRFRGDIDDLLALSHRRQA